jgi:phenylalanyl-tRNA synthetase beta chain
VKFTFSWLKEHLDTDVPLADIVTGLLSVGLEVEQVADRSAELAPFAVAYVRRAEKHPNADRLSLCTVETVNGDVQVVCGAPNARTGMKGIFAPVGSQLPGTGARLEKGVIRGVASNGMLLSERELAISNEHGSIIEVDQSFAVGTPAAVALGLDDAMIYVKVTANRPDALGVRGIARDLAAKGLGLLKPLDAGVIRGTLASPIGVNLRFDDADTAACPLFIGRYFRGVRNASSPDWLSRRLTAIGLRPISALVDITNYLMISYARPLHVFDADRIAGDIHVRLARAGEQIAALDGRTYALDASMTVIADDRGPQGIGGVMGGAYSGCVGETRNVFLEVALFDPVRTAATGRKLAINSDARYRFERGVDPAFAGPGAEIATRMILDLCGGEASELVTAGRVPDTARSCILRSERVKSLAGIDVPSSEQKRILTALGFTVAAQREGLVCSVPSFRPDIQGEADLVEEVCRIVGLDEVPFAPMPRTVAVTRPVLTIAQRRMTAARRKLACRGLNEAVTWSFLPAAHAALFGAAGRNPDLILANPVSSELTDMRPSLVPNLVAAVGRNQARGFTNIGLFEVGQAYSGDRPQDESLRAAGVREGSTGPRHWSGPQRAVDVFDAKADAQAALEAADAPIGSLKVVPGGPAWFHPGRSGTFRLGPRTTLAVFGELHPRVLHAMDVRGPMVAFEVMLDDVPQRRSRSSARPALIVSDLMPVRRDFAFLIGDDVEADEVVKAARNADQELISDVSVFDLFTGSAVGDGKRSIAIDVTITPRKRTLTDADIDALSRKLIADVEKATGGLLRS